jgi:flagellar biosynthetic protein FlhB
MADAGRRTERPTPRRLERAREQGNVPRSKELPGALVLFGLLGFAHVFGASWIDRMAELFRGSFGATANPELDEARLVAVLWTAASATALLLVAPMGTLLVAGLGGQLVQGPPPFTLKPLALDASRLNPAAGLKKMFRLKAGVETLKVAFKMVLYTAVAADAVRDAFAEGLVATPGVEGALVAVFSLSGRVILRVAFVALGLAILDLLFTRFEYFRGLRMTKQEVKDERKEHEGDPLVKMRIRSKQMALARTRMMADVPRATVVVTNPTHYAVALRYVPGDTDVPQLLAKGRGRIAERIREIATAHGVPLVSDPPLARSLYRAVEVGQFIPASLFRAVAEVLALVLRPAEKR